jgi:hypothetical protein
MTAYRLPIDCLSTAIDCVLITPHTPRAMRTQCAPLAAGCGSDAHAHPRGNF